MTIDIDITIQDERWNKAISNLDPFIHEVITKALDKRLNKIEAAEISIVLADDPFIHELNKTYRRKDKPTNVLSFPMTEPGELLNPQTPFCALGDIIMAYDTITREAQEQSKDLVNHFTHMMVHGSLHLLHYDHQNDKEAQIMEQLEIDILSELRIKNPYESQ